MFGKYFQRIGLVTFSHNIYTIFRQPLISIHKVQVYVTSTKDSIYDARSSRFISVSSHYSRPASVLPERRMTFFNFRLCRRNKGGEGWKGIKRFCRLVYYVGVEQELAGRSTFARNLGSKLPAKCAQTRRLDDDDVPAYVKNAL